MNEEVSELLKRELRELQRDLSEPSLVEALRLLESPRFEKITDAQIRAVGEYRPIEVAGERFFDRAWSRSKEAGAMLGFARLLGASYVRQDLRRLCGSVRRRERDAQDRLEPGSG